MIYSKIRLVLAVLLTLSVLMSISESIFLPVTRAGSSLSDSQPDIGIMAWIYTNKYIDIDNARSIFKTIEYEGTDEVLGIYTFYVDNYNTEDVDLYITSDGFIAAYYPSYEPASKEIAWNNDNAVSNKLGTAIFYVGQSLGQRIDYKDIKYYDYRYPDANRMLVVVQSSGESTIGAYNYGNLQFNVPSYSTIYHTSYSVYLNDQYSNGGTNIAIDNDIIDTITYNGVTYGTYNGYISTDTNHLLGIMSGPYAQAGVAMMIIYKDDDDDANNDATIKVSNADNYFDGELESSKYVDSAPTYTPEPTPRRTSRPIRTVPMPTVIITDIPEEGVTPVRTQDILRKPPKASIDLHGERTNIEEGQQSLLKGSIVSFNTNKDKMHAQVIIIPPSGVSVVSADFVKSPAGQYTSDFELEPGKGKDIEVAIVPNEPGEFKVISKVSYYFGDDRDDNGYEELKLDIKVRPRGSGTGKDDERTTQPGNIPKEEPGFEIIPGIGILTISYILFKKIIRR